MSGTNTDNPRLHWYSFSYIGDCRTTGQRPAYASTYTGYPKKRVTTAMLKENKEYAGVADSATLLSVCYLGHMTKKEFKAED